MHIRLSGVGTALLLATLSLTGCSASAQANDPSRPSTTPACTTPSGSEVSVSQADSGATLCLTQGTRLDVFLHGAGDTLWSPVLASGSALHSVPNGKGTLARGVTAGFFAAAEPGTAVLSSTGPGCASGTTASCPSGVFTMTVIVR